MKAIPKRRLIPIITDLLEYRQAANHTIPYVRKMIAQYGDVCEVSFTGVRNYFIHDPEVIKEILTTQSLSMKRTYLFRAFRKFLGNGLFTSDGEYNKRQRRLIKPAFLPQRIEEYADVMVACANDEIDSWKDGDEINISRSMTRITLQAITRAMFGSGLQQHEMESVEEQLVDAFAVMNRIIQNPFYVYCLEKNIRIPIVSRLLKLKAGLDKFISRIITLYRNEESKQRSDLLSMLLAAQEEATGLMMTDEQVKDEVLTFFIAGHETTTLALTWTLYLLGRNPEVQCEFYAEVRAVIGDRIPRAGDYNKLLLTKNIFRESLRLYPPAWTFAREPTEDVIIRDYHFPKGCVLWTITYLLHHSEKYFQHPEAFIPSRWDDAAIRDLPRYSYIPFGGGNRMCIGEGFAWMEGVLVLATIARRCSLVLKEGFTTDVNPLFTLKPRDSILMKCSLIG